MRRDAKPIVYIFGGLALANLSVAAAVFLAFGINPHIYPDISLACRMLGEGGTQCASGARQAGVASLLGLSAALAITWGLRPYAGHEPARIQHELVLPLALAVAVALALAQLLLEVIAVPMLSRVQEISRNSTVISLANLGLPLLLQLSVAAPSFRIRMGYLSAVGVLLCILPFRATLLVAVVFGVVLPAMEALLGGSAKIGLLRWRKSWFAPTGVLGALALVGAIILYQSAQRSAPLITAGPLAERGANGLALKLTQRIVYPLYQAHFAQVVAATERLPTVTDELLTKLRLGGHGNLNEVLYSKIYGPGTVGETTSLYYGEGAARGALSPLAWVAAGPLLYVLAWIALARLGLEAGVLAGLAIWRGSLGGVFEVLPAFVIQSVVLLVLYYTPAIGLQVRGRSAPRDA